MKRLSKIKGGRKRKTGGFHPDVARKLERWAKYYQSTESRAVVIIVSEFFGRKEK